MSYPGKSRDHMLLYGCILYATAAGLVHSSHDVISCHEWVEARTSDKHSPDERCSSIWTRCFSGYNLTSDIKDQFSTLCGFLDNNTVKCPVGHLADRRCMNIECYKALGRLYHGTIKLLSGADNSSSQTVLQLLDSTFFMCQHNQSVIGNEDMLTSEVSEKWTLYKIIILASASYTLGLGSVALCLWLQCLKRRKRLCFAEKRESFQDKWEGASQRVTMKILQKHYPSNADSDGSFTVEIEAFTSDTINNPDQQPEIDTANNADVVQKDVDNNTTADSAGAANVAIDVKDDDAASGREHAGRNQPSSEADTSTAIDTSLHVPRSADKQAECTDQGFRFSEYYEISRDSVASELVCFSLSNDNFENTGPTTEQTIE